MEARAGILDSTVPAWRRVAERFAEWRAPGSEGSFEALAKRFAHPCDHPLLPHFEYAVTANGRAPRPAAREPRGFRLDYGPTVWMALSGIA